MAEYEETVEETEALWTGYMAGYYESITETNPCVAVVRFWLGAGDNNGSWHRGQAAGAQAQNRGAGELYQDSPEMDGDGDLLDPAGGADDNDARRESARLRHSSATWS